MTVVPATMSPFRATMLLPVASWPEIVPLGIWMALVLPSSNEPRIKKGDGSLRGAEETTVLTDAAADDNALVGPIITLPWM